MSEGTCSAVTPTRYLLSAIKDTFNSTVLYCVLPLAGLAIAVLSAMNPMM